MMNGFHHIRARVRATEGLEPFPSRNKLKRFFDYLMYAVGIFAPLALVPQILQIYMTKSGAGISLSTWFPLTLFNILWAIYGALHRDTHILFANVCMALFNSIIIIGVLLY